MRPLGTGALGVVLTLVLAPPAAAQHSAAPGDSLWSIAQANGVSVYDLAAANGRSLDDMLLVGDTLQVPSASAATAAAGATATTTSPAPGMVPVPAGTGTAYLPPTAAANLQALRRESQRQLGIDVYPSGPVSGYRSYAQQAELYRAYQAGVGPRAAPPGTSSHETGRALDLASPVMRRAVDLLGAAYGWQKLDAADEWWHISYTGG